MKQAIIHWLSQVKWSDWNMWAAIGQMIGALATLWTARIALQQIKETRRQADEERERWKQEREEAKREAEDAKKPELEVNFFFRRKRYDLFIILTNMKGISLTIRGINLDFQNKQIGFELLDYNHEQLLSAGKSITRIISLRKLLENMKGNNARLNLDVTLTGGQVLSCDLNFEYTQNRVLVTGINVDRGLNPINYTVGCPIQWDAETKTFITEEIQEVSNKLE
ncbi:hypothetical protein [Laceyella putida]|uniref:Uncharacterized protein n=1 Tax=Laceyella putida TaxID=110101 RepID=A0ABW2RQ66_9BACL